MGYNESNLFLETMHYFLSLQQQTGTILMMSLAYGMCMPIEKLLGSA
jgi:hypothetical protein